MICNASNLHEAKVQAIKSYWSNPVAFICMYIYTDNKSEKREEIQLFLLISSLIN